MPSFDPRYRKKTPGGQGDQKKPGADYFMDTSYLLSTLNGSGQANTSCVLSQENRKIAPEIFWSRRIARYTARNGAASAETIIVDDLPARPDQFFHFGGALSFGPDGKLYLIFGDTNRPDEARNPASLPGSILRYNPDGSIPADNPFPDSPVYAYGIRNGFGLAWHPETGQLYESENGASCDDELNLITPGVDYGWGVHDYDACPYPDDTGRPPLYEWGEIIAPAGMTFYTGTVMPELRGDLLVCSHNRMELLWLALSEDGRSITQVNRLDVPGMSYVCRVDVAQAGWLALHDGGRGYLPHRPLMET